MSRLGSTCQNVARICTVAVPFGIAEQVVIVFTGLGQMKNRLVTVHKSILGRAGHPTIFCPDDFVAQKPTCLCRCCCNTVGDTCQTATIVCISDVQKHGASRTQDSLPLFEGSENCIYIAICGCFLTNLVCNPIVTFAPVRRRRDDQIDGFAGDRDRRGVGLVDRAVGPVSVQDDLGGPDLELGRLRRSVGGRWWAQPP